MNKEEDLKRQNKQDKEILRQNDKLIGAILKKEPKRHVKEPTEPVFKELVREFGIRYGKMVVVKSNVEILKYLKDEIQD